MNRIKWRPAAATRPAILMQLAFFEMPPVNYDFLRHEIEYALHAAAGLESIRLHNTLQMVYQKELDHMHDNMLAGCYGTTAAERAVFDATPDECGTWHWR